MKEVTVIVAGKTVSGKTTIAQIIEDALKAKGISVHLIDDEVPTRMNFEKRVEAISDKTQVLIKTARVARDLTLTN